MNGMESPIITCNLCGSQENLQHVKPSHQLDATLLDFANLKLGDAVG